MRPVKLVFRNAAIALAALALSGCDLCECCSKKKDTDWAAVNRARLGPDGGTGGGGGGTGGDGGGGNGVPEISPHAATAGLTLLGGLGLILADCRRPRRYLNCAVPA